MAKRKARKRRAKRTKRTPREPLSAAAGPSLKTALSGLNMYRKRLVTERAAIDEKISAIEAALRAVGRTPVTGAAQRGRRRAGSARGVRAGSLKYYIGRVLPGRGTMAVKDITGAVRKAGYKTKNKTLGKSVGIALTQMKNVTKVKRGHFRMK